MRRLGAELRIDRMARRDLLRAGVARRDRAGERIAELVEHDRRARHAGDRDRLGREECLLVVALEAASRPRAGSSTIRAAGSARSRPASAPEHWRAPPCDLPGSPGRLSPPCRRDRLRGRWSWRRHAAGPCSRAAVHGARVAGAYAGRTVGRKLARIASPRAPPPHAGEDAPPGVRCAGRSIPCIMNIQSSIRHDRWTSLPARWKGCTAPVRGPGRLLDARVCPRRLCRRARRFLLLHRLCRRQAVPAIRPCRQRGPAGSPDQDRIRTDRQARRDAAQRGGGRLRQARLPRRHADPGADRLGRAAHRRQLAPPRPRHPADPRLRRPRAHELPRARRHRRLYRATSAPAMPARKPTRCCCSPAPSRPQAVPSRARRLPARARPARGRRGAPDLRGAARPARLPHPRLLGRRRRGLAARLLPVLRGPAWQAHRLLALRGARRQRQAGDHHGRKATLRRGAEARRALFGDAARRPAVDRARDAAALGRLQHLCARPQPVRALHRQGLCAAAHRPARHSGGERQHLEA